MNEKIILRDGEIAFLENGQTTMIMNVNTAIDLYRKMRLVQLDTLPEPTDEDIEEVNKEYGLSDMFNDIVKDTAEHLGIKLAFSETVSEKKETSLTKQASIVERLHKKINLRYGNNDRPIIDVTRIETNGCSKKVTTSYYDWVYLVLHGNTGDVEFFESQASADRYLQSLNCPKGAAGAICSNRQHVTYSKKGINKGHVFTVIYTNVYNVANKLKCELDNAAWNIGLSVGDDYDRNWDYETMKKYFKF